MPKMQGFTLGFLDLDNDERLIKSGDYADALNIRRFTSGNGVNAPVKNILGTTAVGNSLPSGTNKCIGAKSLEEVNSVYFFIWNSNGNHSIYQYSSISKITSLIAQDSFLSFQSTTYITGVNAINSINNNGVLLYWTDNITPRKLNVKRAKLHQEGDYVNGYAQEFSSGTDAQKAKYYDAIKHPPLYPPTFSFITDTEKKINKINDGVFQFRYRYIYDDSERSAYSPWSDIAVSNQQKLNNTSTVIGNSLEDNLIRVFISPATSNNVDKVELTFREGNGGDEFTWFDFRNDQGINAFEFYNDTVNIVAGLEDTLKNYDAVPRRAKAQGFKENKLHYANYLEDFNATELSVQTGIAYKKGANYSARVIIPVANIRIYNNKKFYDYELDFSSVPTIEEGLTFIISYHIITVTRDNNVHTPNLGGVSLFYTATGSDDLQDVLDFFTQAIANVDLNPYKRGTATKSGSKIILRQAIKEGFGKIFGVAVSTNSYVVNSGKAEKTFKANSAHPLGVTYFDRGNRQSSVNKIITEPYVKWYTERDTSFQELDGGANIGFILKNQPPSWATHYSIVYAGNSGFSDYLDYTCAGAFKKDGQGTNSFDRLYISLRNFKGDDYSFKESTNALIDYNFAEGDRVLIKSYYDPDEEKRLKPSGNLDFKVVGLEVLGVGAENPLIGSSDSAEVKEQKSGVMLILQDPKLDNWDTEGGTNLSTGHWFDHAAAAGAYFQIYRPKPQVDERPYYEFGHTYPIANAGLSTRYHEGSIRNQNESLEYVVTDKSILNQYVVAFEFNNKIIVGDSVIIKNDSSVVLFTANVTRVELESAGTRLYLDEDLSSFGSIGFVKLASEGAATLLEGGDSWIKPRFFFRGDNVISFRISLAQVEDYYVNDFIKSGNSWDRGRSHFYLPEAKEIIRKTDITASEGFFPDVKFNGLSSFNPTNRTFKQLDLSWGGVQRIEQHNQGFIVWQEDKTTKLLISRSLLENSQGDGTVVVSNDPIGDQIPYGGDYGCSQQPESIVGNHGVWYWMDVKRGKYLRLSNDGITPISNYNVRNYLYGKSKDYLRNYANINIISGYDKENDETIVTFPTLSSTDILVDDVGMVGGAIQQAVFSGDFLQINVTPVLEDAPIELTFSSELRNWEDIEENWDAWGDGNFYNTTEISETGNVAISNDDLINFENGNTTPAYVALNTTTEDKLTLGTLDLGSGILSVPINNADYPIITSGAEVIQQGFTLAYYEPANRWSTFYSFDPEQYACINSLFFSFERGNMWLHNSGSNYGKFYGVDYPAKVTPILNPEPFTVKTYRAAMIEGNAAWDLDITTNLNGCDLLSTDFENKEGRFYAQLPFSETGTTDSNVIGIGDISTIATNTITVNGFFAAGSGLFVGDKIYLATTEIGSVVSIGADNTIVLSTSSGLSAGDYIYALRNSAIDGDTIRGYWAKVAMTNSVTGSEVELYSVDLQGTKSFY